MRNRIVWMACFCTLALLCMAGAAAAEENDGTVVLDDIEPYNGPIGAGSPLYGLKIAFEDLDLSFTANETDYINKQLNKSRLRLSEVRAALQQNNTDAAGNALALYLKATNDTRHRLELQAGTNATGLLHAQEMIVKHQLVLEHLIDLHPNNTGLQHAYNNSLALEQKFQEKTQVRLERLAEKNKATIIKAVRLELRQQTSNDGLNETLRIQETSNAGLVAANGNDSKPGQAQGPAEQANATPHVDKAKKNGNAA
jgi:hypothetical protein